MNTKKIGTTDPLYDVFDLDELQKMKTEYTNRKNSLGKGESVRCVKLKKKLDRIDRAINRK